jgi:hypothetical protein
MGVLVVPGRRRLVGAGQHPRERGGGTSGTMTSMGARVTWARDRGARARAGGGRAVGANFTLLIDY